MFSEGQEHMFDSDSFKQEITSKEEAQSAYNYFAHNLTSFRSQLEQSGKSYEEVQETLRQCWTNLIQSSEKVGYRNSHMDRAAKLYGIGSNKALPKSEAK